MNDRERKNAAERLFDVIGMIDDSLVAESESYIPKPKKIQKGAFYIRRAVAIAAAFAVLTVGVLATSLISKFSNEDGSDDFDNTVGTTNSSDRLGGTLDSACVGGLALKVPLADIDFFDGKINLIWQYDGESEYYVLGFDNSQSTASELKKEISKGGEQISKEDAENITYRVWVSYGNGEVVSPHLKENAGNVGCAELFEYSPEIVPGKGFEEFVNEATKG